jgi:hypothetical protein
MLPPADRLIDAQLDHYISDKLYWVLHAPRQTGKTTFLFSWMLNINAGDEEVACYVSLERCQKLLAGRICSRRIGNSSGMLKTYMTGKELIKGSSSCDMDLKQVFFLFKKYNGIGYLAAISQQKIFMCESTTLP